MGIEALLGAVSRLFGNFLRAFNIYELPNEVTHALPSIVVRR